jgi:hypothetical protein
LNICVAQNPNFLPAHRRLALLYERRVKNPAKAAEHREKIRAVLAQFRAHAKTAEVPVALDGTEPGTHPAAGAPPLSRRDTVQENPLLRGVPEGRGVSSCPPSKGELPVPLAAPRSDAAFVTVVSGLPRSGTSLMMQMLAAGGLPPLHDGHRPADIDNPRGYFEFAPAKNLRADASWVPQARGRAVKLVAQLLPFLPAGQGFDYRIVWMERELEEVLASQNAMLTRQGRGGAEIEPTRLRAVFEQQLARITEILARRRLAVLRVQHADAIADPGGTAARLVKFLALPLDRKAMAAVVDPSLHRQKR